MHLQIASESWHQYDIKKFSSLPVGRYFVSCHSTCRWPDRCGLSRAPDWLGCGHKPHVSLLLASIWWHQACCSEAVSEIQVTIFIFKGAFGYKRDCTSLHYKIPSSVWTHIFNRIRLVSNEAGFRDKPLLWAVVVVPASPLYQAWWL